MKNKKSLLIAVSLMTVLVAGCFAETGLTSMLGISACAAKKLIDIIDTFTTVAMIISLVSAIIGAGAISAALVAAAKKMIKKYGKKYATMW